MNEYFEYKLKQFMKEQYFRQNTTIQNIDDIMSLDYWELIQCVEEQGFKLYMSKLYTEIKLFWRNTSNAVKYKIPIQVELILSTLYSASKQSYLVGGCVRDSINMVESKDWDFVTDIPYDSLKDIILYSFPDATFKETGKQFLVLNCTIDNITYEIANFRKDGVYLDGRRPESVEIGTIEDDAKRRDFTVNALYWNYDGLKAPVHTSIDDTQSKTLRFIGNPKDRINEDALRIFRFYRFIKTKGFNPDKQSLQACRAQFDLAMKVSSQRVMMELERIVL